MTVIINWFAVIAAAVAGLLLGWLWYGPLFGRAWMKEVHMSDEDTGNADMGKVLGLTFAFLLIMAYCLAMFFGSQANAVTGTLYGFLTGFAWVSLALGVNAMFEQKTWRYILINGGYWSLVFSVMGLIIGAWH